MQDKSNKKSEDFTKTLCSLPLIRCGAHYTPMEITLPIVGFETF